MSTVNFHSLRPMLRTNRGPVELMVAAPNSHMPFVEPAFTGSFYFNVDDAAALWAALKDSVKVCYPMEDFHY